MDLPQVVEIKVPIWKGRKVGINETMINEHGINVKILYKNKDGRRIYPYTYYVDKHTAMQMPVQILSGGIKLRIIPISMMKVIENQEESK